MGMVPQPVSTKAVTTNDIAVCDVTDIKELVQYFVTEGKSYVVHVVLNRLEESQMGLGDEHQLVKTESKPAQIKWANNNKKVKEEPKVKDEWKVKEEVKEHVTCRVRQKSTPDMDLLTAEAASPERLHRTRSDKIAIAQDNINEQSLP